MVHHYMLKEAHTISYIQQVSHEWIERDEEVTTWLWETSKTTYFLANVKKFCQQAKISQEIEHWVDYQAKDKI